MQIRPLCRVAALPALLLLVSACAPTPGGVGTADALAFAESPIINGAVADEGDFPPAVSLSAAGTDGSDVYLYGSFCSGTMIAPDVVLTAAHCIQGASEVIGQIQGEDLDPLIYVTHTVNANQQFPDDAAFAVDGLLHPAYGSGDQSSDVGLLFLQNEAPGEFAYIVDDQEVEWVRQGQAVTLVGWGLSSTNNPSSGGIKRWAQTSIMGISEKEIIIGVAPDPRAGVVVSLCYGDSGGPMFLDVKEGIGERIVGITSHGVSDGDCEDGAASIRADYFRSWIESEMQNACGTDSRPSCSGDGGLPSPPGRLGAAPAGYGLPEELQSEIEEFCQWYADDCGTPTSTCIAASTAPYWQLAHGCDVDVDAEIDAFRACVENSLCYSIDVPIQVCPNEWDDYAAAVEECPTDFSPAGAPKGKDDDDDDNDDDEEEPGFLPFCGAASAPGLWSFILFVGLLQRSRSVKRMQRLR